MVVSISYFGEERCVPISSVLCEGLDYDLSVPYKLASQNTRCPTLLYPFEKSDGAMTVGWRESVETLLEVLLFDDDATCSRPLFARTWQRSPGIVESSRGKSWRKHLIAWKPKSRTYQKQKNFIMILKLIQFTINVKEVPLKKNFHYSTYYNIYLQFSEFPRNVFYPNIY